MKQRKLFLSVFFCVLVGASYSAPSGGRLGLGLVIGEPTGVAVGWRLGNDSMLQGTLAWDLTAPGGLTVAGDYLLLFDELLIIDKVAVPLYAGIGGKLTILSGGGSYGGSDFPFGLVARVPLGVRWLFDDVPLEAFLELVPGLRLIPDTAFDIGGGLGLRWYFKN